MHTHAVHYLEYILFAGKSFVQPHALVVFSAAVNRVSRNISGNAKETVLKQSEEMKRETGKRSVAVITVSKTDENGWSYYSLLQAKYTKRKVIELTVIINSCIVRKFPCKINLRDQTRVHERVHPQLIHTCG